MEMTKIVYFIYLCTLFKKKFLYLTMMNRLYVVVNISYTMTNKLFTIIIQFNIVVSNLYIMMNKLFTKNKDIFVNSFKSIYEV